MVSTTLLSLDLPKSSSNLLESHFILVGSILSHSCTLSFDFSVFGLCFIFTLVWPLPTGVGSFLLSFCWLRALRLGLYQATTSQGINEQKAPSFVQKKFVVRRSLRDGHTCAVSDSQVSKRIGAATTRPIGWINTGFAKFENFLKQLSTLTA